MKRKLIPILLAAVLVLTLIPTSTLSAGAIELNPDTGWHDGGPGPFTISTANQLAGLAQIVNSGAYRFVGRTIILANNIDLGNAPWIPIGNADNVSFNGTFDGAGHSITGLNVSGNHIRAGLFGTVVDGTIRNLTVMGTVNNNSAIFSDVGGLVAWMSNGRIENCLALVNVTAMSGTGITNTAGGLVGSAGSFMTGTSFIINSAAAGNVNSNADFVGGLIGRAQARVVIENTYATGNVHSTNTHANGAAGGLIGISSSLVAAVPAIRNSYAAGNVTGTANRLGGFAGAVTHGAVANTCVWNTDAVMNGTGETGNNATFAAVGLTRNEMTDNNALTTTMAGLGSAFTARANTATSHYFPELLVFGGSDSSRASVTSIVIDRDALTALIAQARAIVNANYTDTSWNALQMAIAAAQAVLDNPYATQEQVSGQVVVLQSAIDGLAVIADNTALIALIAQARAIARGNYTDANWYMLQTAIAAAQVIADNGDATQVQVNEQVTALQNAIDRLRIADTIILISWIDAARTFTRDNYTDASWYALQDAIDAAQAVLDNPNATQAQVDEQVTALQNAINGLTPPSRHLIRSWWWFLMAIPLMIAAIVGISIS